MCLAVILMMQPCVCATRVYAEQADAAGTQQEQTENTGETEEKDPSADENAPGENEQESPEDTGTETEEPVRDFVVVLDPGHGGADGGASREGYVERDLVLKIAYYCKEELEKHPGVTVYLTRTDNTSSCVGRDVRAEFAWEKEADLVVSLHLNSTASGSTSQSGAEVYYPNSNYKPELGDLGYRAASSILTEICGVGLANNGCKTRPSNDTWYFDGSVADYLGINYWCKLKGIPGVLVEHAYINNPNDRAYCLSTEEGLKALGVADARGILNYFDENPDACIERTGSWEYEESSEKWWYQRPDGTYPWSSWEMIDGHWFYFDYWGYRCTGWQQIGTRWYYLGDRGIMQTGWHKINGSWYYLDTDSGAMAEGWLQDKGQWYFLYPGSGKMVTGWLNIGDSWYYMYGSGAMATGWVKDGANWYYMGDNGAMEYGWQEINGNWYYFYGSGKMAANTKIGSCRVDGNGAWVR